MTNGNLRTRAARAIAQVTSEIERNIETGTWQPGYKLPTERDLEMQFGVARNTLRKGLKRLESEGRIIRQVGRGSFVAGAAGVNTSEAAGLLSRLLGSSPSEVMEVRLQMEPWAASLAATRATAGDLAHLRACVMRADTAPDIETFEHWDGELHIAIVAAAKNELLSGLYGAINAVRHQPEWMSLKKRTVTPCRRDVYQDQHGAIVDALSERNAARAAQLVREHLSEVRRNLMGEDTRL